MKNKKIYALFILIILIGILVSIQNEKQKFSSPKEKKYPFEVEYKNLTTQEKNYSEFLLSQLKKKYTIQLKKVIFTHSTKEQCRKIRACKKLCPTGECEGLNYADSKTIYVNWYFGKEKVKKNLCHEILHFWIIQGKTQEIKDPYHQIIYDLVEQEVCYKKSHKGGV